MTLKNHTIHLTPQVISQAPLLILRLLKRLVSSSIKSFPALSYCCNFVGDGAYSNVFKVKRHEDGQEYALKKVKLDHLSEKERENAINEVRILASVKHVNVIQYKEAFIDEKSHSLCIIMELADDGDVFQKIVNHKKDKTYIKER